MNNFKTDWRFDALNTALQARTHDGDATAALLACVRIQRPHGTTLLLRWLDREQAMEFVRANTSEQKSLTPGADWARHDNDEHLHLGWIGVKWQGHELELALPSGGYHGQGELLILGDDDEATRRFGAELFEFAQRPRRRCLLFSGSWENSPELDEQMGVVTWDDITLPPDTMRALREAVEGFFAHRAAYEALEFAWRRGILLVGPPGTGKTMICKAVASAIENWPFLYVRDLGQRGEQDAIRSIFERARSLAPCILAFEDIDGLVNDHNRSVFLNEMDGFESNSGVFVVASSNHPGKIDEALLKRPSRFDRVFHIGLPKTPERAEYCRRLLTRTRLAEKLTPDFEREKLVEAVAEKSDGFTPAYLKEAFTAAALQRAQAGALLLDAAFAEAVLAQVEELKGHLKRAKVPEQMTEMRAGDDVIGFRR